MGVIKVKPYGKGQGDYVLLAEENFDSSFHSLYDPEGDAMREKEQKEAAAKLVADQLAVAEKQKEDDAAKKQAEHAEKVAAAKAEAKEPVDVKETKPAKGAK